jgi:antibiotic biosynthesis monooxygenase (ABM) superfamily enzyme
MKIFGYIFKFIVLFWAVFYSAVLLDILFFGGNGNGYLEAAITLASTLIIICTMILMKAIKNIPN